MARGLSSAAALTNIARGKPPPLQALQALAAGLTLALPQPPQVNRSRPSLVLADPNLHFGSPDEKAQRTSGFFNPK